VKPRTVMSSIMRWRSGLIASSVIGLLLSRDEVQQTPNLNTGQTLPVNPQTDPPSTSNYRESGLVL
jgi:hypothetical protein